LNSAHTGFSAADTLHEILNSLQECDCFLYSHVVVLKLQRAGARKEPRSARRDICPTDTTNH